MKRTTKVLVLCALAMAVLWTAHTACLAYTVEDMAKAASLMGKADTHDRGLELLREIVADQDFASAHPEESAQASLRLAQDITSCDKADQAVPILEKGLSVVPSSSVTKRALTDLLAWMQYESGQVDKSIVLYQQLIADYPTENVSLWKQRLGECYAAMAQYDKALSVSEEVVAAATKPADAVASRQMIARCQHEQKKYEDEVATLHKLSASVPGSPDAKAATTMADVITLIWLPQSKQDAVVSAGKQEAVRHLMDFANNTQDRYRDGIAAMNKALEVGPDDPKLVVEIDYWLGNQYRASDQHEQAIAMGEKLLRDAPDRAFDAKMLIGYGYQCLKQYDKAIPVLEDVVKNIDPKHCGAKFNLATCYNMTGRYDEATALYDKVAANAECPGVAGRCLVEKATMLASKLNKPDEAIAAYKQAFSVTDAPHPEDTAAFLKALEAAKPGKSGTEVILGGADGMSASAKTALLASLAETCSIELGRPIEAGGLYLRLASLISDEAKSAEYEYQAADCYYVAEKWAMAADTYQTLCTKHPTAKRRPDAKVMAGYCYLRADNVAKARKAFQEVASEYADTPYADVAKRQLTSLANLDAEGGDSK